MCIVPERPHDEVLEESERICQEDPLMDYNIPMKKQSDPARCKLGHKRTDSRDLSGYSLDDDSFFNQSRSTIGTTPNSPIQNFYSEKNTQKSYFQPIDLDEVTKQYCYHERQLSMIMPKENKSSKHTPRISKLSEHQTPRGNKILVKSNAHLQLSSFGERDLEEKINLREILEESRAVEKTSTFDIYDDCLSQVDQEARRSLPGDFKFQETLAEDSTSNRLLANLRKFSFLR